ncbi:MAG: hypothetical protein ACRDOK_24425 [Streptosporangiaceae bacterium]
MTVVRRLAVAAGMLELIGALEGLDGLREWRTGPADAIAATVCSSSCALPTVRCTETR